MFSLFGHTGARALGATLFAYCFFVAFTLAGQAGQSKTTKDGVFSSAQATRGDALFKDKCAKCHDASLKGGLGPPLTGDAFNSVWADTPISALVNKIQRTMPQDAAGTLNRDQVIDVVAHILDVGKYPAGAALASDDPSLKAISFPPASAPAPTTAAAGSAHAFPPVGNMGQVMRGILFPSSNIIFNAQAEDPGAPKAAYDQGKGAFSWAAWGAGIYSQWEMVDYAAIAIAEAAPLLMVPGRRCENGKPVPIGDPEWIKATNDLVETGKAVYKWSQGRNVEGIDDIAGQLADACLNCHVVYRDKPGGTPADPSNKAARCFK